MSKVYVVDHVREYYRDPKDLNKKYLDFKGIGNFYSLEKAKNVVSKYKNVEGFRDYPNGFRITEYTIDSIYNKFINELMNTHLPQRKEKLSKIFSLYYVFENEEGDEDVLLLGLFSKEKKAFDARQKILAETPLKHLASNLQIFEESIDRMNWEEGFITWEKSLKGIPKSK